MGIDHVGNKGPPAARPPETGSVDRPAPAGRPFEIERKSTVAPPDGGVSIQAPSTALERYRAGEVDIDGYLDLKATEATAHLVVSVPAETLEEIRRALRDRLATDPTLSELARIATGAEPVLPGAGAEPVLPGAGGVPEPGGQE